MLSHAFLLTLRPLLDIEIQPQFDGLPPQIEHGLVHLTDNLAAVLVLASGLGIVISLLGLQLGHWLGSHALRERFKQSLFMSAGAGALLFTAVAASNYATALFR
jgi:hypothetical protein